MSTRRSARAALAWLWLVALLPLMAACMRPAQSAQAATRPALELALADADGKPLSLSRFQGRPVLLFLFSTSDTGSQLALTHLLRWLTREPGVQALGIALQPDARVFLAPYRDALGVSFPLTYDPSSVILHGESDLGPVAAVPAFVVLDERGRERARHYGVLTEAELQSFVDDALQR